jgi:hypothetical protein
MYIEQQDLSTAVDVMFIEKWRDYAFTKMMEKKTQKKIADFFQYLPDILCTALFLCLKVPYFRNKM